MMIRSMPPASAHLALRPVPAPPPMMGRPAATFRRKLSRISLRNRWNMGALVPVQEFDQQGRRGVGKCRIVDVFVTLDESDPRVAPQPTGQGIEQGTVGGGIVEGLTRRVERR